jgi:hypothetical protein
MGRGRRLTRWALGLGLLLGVVGSLPVAAQGGLEEVLDRIPADALGALAFELEAAPSLLLGQLPDGWLGAGRPLEAALDGTLARRLGIEADLERAAVFLASDGRPGAVLGLGAVRGTPSAPAVRTYRGWALYALEAGPDVRQPDLAAVGTDLVIAGSLEGVTGVLDVVSGAIPSLRAQPGARDLIGELGPEAIAVALGSEALMSPVLYELFEFSVTTGMAAGTLFRNRVRLSIASVEPAEIRLLETELAGLRGSLMLGLGELAREADEASDFAEELAMRLTHELGLDLVEAMTTRVVGSTVHLEAPLHGALLAVPFLSFRYWR